MKDMRVWRDGDRLVIVLENADKALEDMVTAMLSEEIRDVKDLKPAIPSKERKQPAKEVPVPAESKAKKPEPSQKTAEVPKSQEKREERPVPVNAVIRHLRSQRNSKKLLELLRKYFKTNDVEDVIKLNDEKVLRKLYRLIQ